jgi:hypothetical protein
MTAIYVQYEMANGSHSRKQLLGVFEKGTQEAEKAYGRIFRPRCTKLTVQNINPEGETSHVQTA